MTTDHTDPAEIARGLTKAQQRAYLTAAPQMYRGDPEALFVIHALGVPEGNLPGTFLPMRGLLLTGLGLAVRAIVQSQDRPDE